MSRQNTVVEMKSSGAIKEAKRRWRYITLMVLTVHTFLIATCLTLIFTNVRFSAEERKHEPTESTNTILLRLENKGVIKQIPSNSTLGLLEFRTVPTNVTNIKVDNKTVITIICRGPYILYPYLEDASPPHAFNITVFNLQQKKVLALIPFNTTDKSTWQSRILSLDENERISVYVNCSEGCPYVGSLCLGLHFMLGSVCLSDLAKIET